MNQRTTARRLITALLLSALLLAGSCGQNTTDNDDRADWQAKEPNTLHVFIWPDYLNPDLVKNFESVYNCKVVIDYYDSNEGMYAKLKAGAAKYDIIVPSSYMIPNLVKEDLIQKHIGELLPNLAHLDPNYTKLLSKEQLEFAVPYMVSYTGVGITQDVPEEAKSWNIFADESYKGRMTMLDDPREAIGAALKFNGHSINSTSDSALAEAEQTLITWKKNLAKFENSQYHYGLASGEFMVTQGWSGDVLQVQAENEGIQFFLPKEGFPLTCDMLAIPKQAPAPKLAHNFINFLHQPDNAAKNTEHIRYACPNKASYQFLPEALRNHPAIFPSAEALEKAEFIVDQGEDNAKYSQVWDRVKAAK